MIDVITTKLFLFSYLFLHICLEKNFLSATETYVFVSLHPPISNSHDRSPAKIIFDIIIVTNIDGWLTTPCLLNSVFGFDPENKTGYQNSTVNNSKIMYRV